jgi:hypothetical protein
MLDLVMSYNVSISYFLDLPAAARPNKATKTASFVNFIYLFYIELISDLV